MAIYSCNLKSIGRTTHIAGTAGAHIRYISRKDAQPVIIAQHMPEDPVQARTWMDGRERDMRKNARVIDKIRLALPRELSKEQRTELVSKFMSELTDNRIPWFAAIHQTGKDAHNPHAHIAVHDRDIDHGKRVLRLSDSTRDRIKSDLPGPKAVDWIREQWESICNKELAKAGLDVRIDRRSLEAQGLDRKPAIHEGPRAQHINDQVKRPLSKERINGCGRVIDYPFIDKGRTRREFNAHIIDLNLAREAGSDNTATRIWALFEKEQIALDERLEKRLISEQRKRTGELRQTSWNYQKNIEKLQKERKRETNSALQKVSKTFTPQREAMKTRQQGERQDLKDSQSRLHQRIFALLDLTGITRRKQEAARKQLSGDHRAKRLKLTEQYRETRELAKKTVKASFTSQIEKQQSERFSHLAQIQDQHKHAEIIADRERQQRELEREQMFELTKRKIKEYGTQPSKQKKTPVAPDLLKALQKAAKQEADRDDERGKDKGDDNERER